MQEVLKKKIEELTNEARALVEQREKIFGVVQEIEVRLHQIAGAITELDSLLKGSSNEASTDGGSQIPTSTSGADEAAPAAEDGI